MIKKLFFLSLVTFFCNQIYCQSIKDTLLFHKNVDGTYQLVFIDAPQSSYHKKVIESLISDKVSVNEKLVFPVNSKLLADKKIISKFLGDWISTFNFKEKEYAYYPSEPYYNLYIKITDSTIILNDFNEGGLVPYAIKEATKQNGVYIFKIISPSKEEHAMNFYVINNNQIAVKSLLFNRQNIWLTKKENYLKLPIIVNLCPGERCGEFHFK
jgi:hypothetical protein